MYYLLYALLRIANMAAAALLRMYSRIFARISVVTPAILQFYHIFHFRYCGFPTVNQVLLNVGTCVCGM